MVKGDDIRSWMELTPDEQGQKWDEALSHEQIVWARVSPAHKLLIVENAQRRGTYLTRIFAACGNQDICRLVIPITTNLGHRFVWN